MSRRERAPSGLIYHTVPWAPSFEREQLRRLGAPGYLGMRVAAACWQLGIRKGFDRESVKARIALEPAVSPARLALELGMLELECDRLADEMCS